MADSSSVPQSQSARNRNIVYIILEMWMYMGMVAIVGAPVRR
jgi:hypothetical protein